ncbi:MAG: hypothetical protein O2949_04300 [Proteobacteria bacterium]|nr:hypothetical protein [Pseudomonadota bacterium]
MNEEQANWAEYLELAAVDDPVKPCLDADRTVTEAQAYAVLKQRCLLRPADPVVGFKGALTNSKVQATFGATQPVLGLLFESGDETGSSIKAEDYKRGMIETELGFCVGASISEPLHHVEQLSAVIASTCLMVEFVDLAFSEFPPSLADLIMHNAAGKAFVRGESQPFNAAAEDALAGLKLRLEMMQSNLHEAYASDVLGDQRQGLLWMINAAIARGFTIEPGHYFMTGSVGEVHALQVGTYALTCQGFETLTFTVV